MTSVTYYPGYSQTQVAMNLTWQMIASITNANPMVVTTTNNSNYNPGMIVTFNIPPSFGMKQLNGLTAQVINVSGTNVTCNVNSTNFSTFSYPSPLPNAYTPPTIIPYSSGQPLAPTPLPYGNENSLVGTIYNAGEI
jgi:hypothetical protein